MASERDDNGFLSRWSRRKRGRDPQLDEQDETTEVETSAVRQTETTPSEKGGVVEPEETEEERENREAAEAVDIEELAYESDFSLFLKRGVPDALRRKAMRKLWTSNPVLANVDGLNDYDEDFADPALNVFRSTWQVGRGFLTDADRKTPVAAATVANEERAEIEKKEATANSAAEEAFPENAASEDLTVADDSTLNVEDSPVSDRPSDDPEVTPEQDAQAEEPPVRRVSLRSRLLDGQD